MRKRHAGWFWNVVLPLGLFLGALAGVGMMIADLCWDGVLSEPLGWLGLAVLVSCAVAFKLVWGWLACEDGDRGRE